MREQTWQKCQAVNDFANPIARAKSRAKKARAPGDLLFLSFAKSKYQFPWRWPIVILCILLWEFANSNKCQVNLPKPLEMLCCLVGKIFGFGYCSTFVCIWQLLFNYGLIRVKNSSHKLWTNFIINCLLSIFNISCMHLKIRCYWEYWENLETKPDLTQGLKLLALTVILRATLIDICYPSYPGYFYIFKAKIKVQQVCYLVC